MSASVQGGNLSAATRLHFSFMASTTLAGQMFNATGRNAKQTHHSLGKPSKKCFLQQNSIPVCQETVLNLIGLPYTGTYRSMGVQEYTYRSMGGFQSIPFCQETLLNLIGLPFTGTYRSMGGLLAFVGGL